MAVGRHDADRGIIAASYSLSDALGNEAIVLGANYENGTLDPAPLDRNTEDRHLAPSQPAVRYHFVEHCILKLARHAVEHDFPQILAIGHHEARAEYRRK